MSDERSDSLAAQAASWVPPWERTPRPPDRDFQARAVAEHEAEAEAEPEAVAEPEMDAEHEAVAEHAGDDEDRDEESGVSPLAGETGEPGTVDAPVEVPGHEPAVMDPDVEVPGPIEEAVAEPAEPGAPVDAPLPPDGDDAGGVFDHAAEDDVSDDAEVDLPFHEADQTDAVNLPGDAADQPGDARAAAGKRAGPAGKRPRAPRQPVGADTLDGHPGTEGTNVPEEAGPEETATAPMEDAELRAALEAILLVVDEPVAELQLAQIVEEPVERVGAVLEDISARYTAAGHGFDLRRAAGGWRLYTRPEYATYVERFVLDGQSVRLTQAALETLAVVAYKQPVTRSRISAIRGVNCDGVMRTLATRGLIEECGTEPETGAHLYRTTGLFLEKLGLDSVDQLPPLAPFLPDDVEEVLDASPG